MADSSPPSLPPSKDSLFVNEGVCVCEYYACACACVCALVYMCVYVCYHIYHLHEVRASYN